MTEALYQVLLLGRSDARSNRVIAQLQSHLAELGLAQGIIEILAEVDAGRRTKSLPAVALFTGYEDANDAAHPALEALLDDSITIITMVSDLENVLRQLPQKLRHINALPVALDQNIGNYILYLAG
jgi:hypothetical protein